MQAGVEFAFAVFPEPAAFVEPGEGAFDNPAFGNDSKLMEFIAFGTLNSRAKYLKGRRGEGLAGSAAIGKHVLHFC